LGLDDGVSRWESGWTQSPVPAGLEVFQGCVDAIWMGSMGWSGWLQVHDLCSGRQKPSILKKEPSILKKEPSILKKEPSILKKEPSILKKEPSIPQFGHKYEETQSYL
jgi:hypothetical protein